MVTGHADDHLQPGPVTGRLELARHTVTAVLPVPHEPPHEPAVDGPAGGPGAPAGEGRDVPGHSVQATESRDQTGVPCSTAGQTSSRREVVLGADVDLPLRVQAGLALGPGRLPHRGQAGGQPTTAGALLRPVEPDPVGEEVLAGHHAGLGVHLLTAEGHTHGVIDGQNEFLVSLPPCGEKS